MAKSPSPQPRYKKRRSCTSRTIEDKKKALRLWDMHRTGKPPSQSAILAYCSWRFKSFKTKTRNAKHKWIARFIGCNNLSDRVKQHFGSYHVADLQTMNIDFSAKVRRFIKEGAFEAENVWNMDQTGVIYDMKPKKVVVERETKKVCDVNLEASQRSFRLTAFQTISASGEKLQPLLILQATPGGDIEKKEVPTLPTGAKYIVQHNGWTDEVVMLNHIRLVLTSLSKA